MTCEKAVRVRRIHRTIGHFAEKSSKDKNVRPRAELETASRGRLRLVGPPQVGRKTALAEVVGVHGPAWLTPRLDPS